MTPITLTVRGLPAPQGSKRHIGRGVMVESSKRVKPWRDAAGDIDKLTRSTLDALVSAGMLADDSQVCHLVAERVYATHTGALIQIQELH